MDNLLIGQDSSISVTQPKEENSEVMECPICKKESTMTCSACKLVAYCSVDHQKLDWKNHKKVCQPFIIKETEDMGLGWFATRDLKAGVLLIDELPVLIVPQWTKISRDYNTKKCLSCGVKSESMRFCSTCSWPVCNDQCEKNPLHMDNECKELKLRNLKYPPPADWPFDLLMTYMRAKALKARDPQKFKHLMALQDSALPSAISASNLSIILLRELFEMMSGSNSLDRDEFQKLLKIIVANGRVLIEGSKESIIPVYLKTSRINHSCFPNCTAHVESLPTAKLQVRTLIAINKGQQLTCNFFCQPDISFQSTAFRQTNFKSCGFICKCKRCHDPTELGTFLTGIKCFNCSSTLTPNSSSVGYFLPAEPLGTDSSSPDPELDCHRCHVKCPTSQVMETLPASLRILLSDILSLTLANPVDHKALDTLLTKYEEDQAVNGHLHKNYWTILGATKMLIKLQMDHLEEMTEEELERLMRRLEFRLTIDDKIYPGSGVHAKYKDLSRLCKLIQFLGFKFGSGINPRMSKEKRYKLSQSENKAQIGRLEHLMLQGDDQVSQEDKASFAAELQQRKMQDQLFREHPNINVILDFQF